mgnify:CR=1 FL=1
MHDFSKNPNRSLRVVGGACRHGLVSPGHWWQHRHPAWRRAGLTAMPFQYGGVLWPMLPMFKHPPLEFDARVSAALRGPIRSSDPELGPARKLETASPS